MISSQQSENLNVLCIGDLHFDCSNKEVTEKLLQVSIEVIEEKKPDCVIILGDLLHKKCPHQSVFDRLEKYLRKIHEISEQLIVLIGNHDRVNDSVFLGDCHYFNAFKDWERMIIVDEVTIVNLKSFSFICVPYVKDGRFLEAIETRVNKDQISDYDFIFAHQMFSTHSPSGDVIHDYYPGIGSGHVHEYYNSSKDENVNFKLLIYFGSVHQVSFAESEDKSFSLLTFKEGQDIPDEERIKIRLTQKNTKYINYSEFENLKFDKKQKLEETRIVIKIDQSELKSLKSSLKYKNLLVKGVKIKEEISKNNERNIKDIELDNVQFIDKLKNILTTEEIELCDDLKLFSLDN